MGICTSTTSSSGKLRKTARPLPPSHHFKAKVHSKTLIFYSPEHQSFPELEITMDSDFQAGALSLRMNSGEILFIGGRESDCAFILDLKQRLTRPIKPPPLNLAYGSLHLHYQEVFVVGSISPDSNEGVPALYYNLSTNTWHEAPSMPLNVSLAGSFKVKQYIYLIGGFLNYPNNPSPYKSMLILDCEKKVWTKGTIESPVRQGVPACAVLSTGVLVLGGHDPLENFCSEESKKTYFFDMSTFSELDELPAAGSLRFSDPPFASGEEVLIYSEDEILFKYSLKLRKWSFLDTESEHVDEGPLPQYKSSGHYVYHYMQEDCEIKLYDLDEQKEKFTGPSTFQYFCKYSGSCILPDGKILFAGGIMQDYAPCATCWALNPELKYSVAMPNLPYEQYGLRLLSIGRQIFGVAGVERRNNTTESRCQVYNIDDNSWRVISSMLMPTFLPGCCYFSNKIYCLGGKAEESGSLNYYLIQSYSADNDH